MDRYTSYLTFVLLHYIILVTSLVTSHHIILIQVSDVTSYYLKVALVICTN